MAAYYLSSVDGSNADDGLTWATAKATLAHCLAFVAPGDTIYVDNAHAESQTSDMTLTSAGTAASPVKVICVSRAGNPEPPTTLATTATVSTGTIFSIIFHGFAYCYGIIFQAGSGSSTANLQFTSNNPWWWRLENCGLKLNNTGAGNISIGSTSSTDDNLLECINSTITIGALAQTIQNRAILRVRGGLITGAATILCSFSNSFMGIYDFRGVDLNIGAGTIIGMSALSYGVANFVNCRFGSATVLTTGTVASPGGIEARFVNCDTTDTIYRYFRQTYAGTIANETSILLRGGASNGSTFTSHKMISTANAKLPYPLESDPITIWHDKVGGTYTATIEIITDNVTLTDADVWLEVEYMGTTGLPTTSFVSDRVVSLLTTPVNQTTSTANWLTTGLTTPVKQKLVVSFIPAKKGLVSLRVMLAKASTTMYFDFDPDTVIS